MRSMTDEGESLIVVFLPHPVGCADHLLPGEKEEDSASSPTHPQNATETWKSPSNQFIPSSMFKRLYDWTIALGARPSAPYALGAVSFAESSFFPIPPDVVLAPMVLAKPERAYHYAMICTVTSVLGGLAGYAIGVFFWDTIGQWLISLYGGKDKIDSLLGLYREYGALLILIKGLTPIPYKFVTIASGIAGYDLFWFIVLSIITRGARFFGVALLLTTFGGPIRAAMDKHGGLIAATVLISVVAGFFIVKALL
jgi:membrane protein YqaA with SNARE-associated domain